MHRKSEPWRKRPHGAGGPGWGDGELHSFSPGITPAFHTGHPLPWQGLTAHASACCQALGCCSSERSPGHWETYLSPAPKEAQRTQARRLSGKRIRAAEGEAHPSLPYPQAGASWAHRALVGLPGRAEDRAHRHARLGGTVPSSSGRSPGSQDRQLHLGRKQKPESDHRPAQLSPCAEAVLPWPPLPHRADPVWPGSGHCSGQALPLNSQRSGPGRQAVPTLIGTPLPHPLPRVHVPGWAEAVPHCLGGTSFPGQGCAAL